VVGFFSYYFDLGTRFYSHICNKLHYEIFQLCFSKARIVIQASVVTLECILIMNKGYKVHRTAVNRNLTLK